MARVVLFVRLAGDERLWESTFCGRIMDILAFLCYVEVARVNTARNATFNKAGFIRSTILLFVVAVRARCPVQALPRGLIAYFFVIMFTTGEFCFNLISSCIIVL